MSTIAFPHTYEELFKTWHGVLKHEKQETIYIFLVQNLKLDNLSENISNNIGKWARLLNLEYQRKWDKSNRTLENFKRKHKTWLEKNISLPDEVISCLHPGPSSKNKRGRPLKPFKEISLASKKRRVSDLVSSRCPEELAFAVEQTAIPNETQQKSLSSISALALYLDLSLSFRKYNILRTTMNHLYNDILPSYYSLQKTKRQLLPSNLIVSDIHAEVQLKDLLSKTTNSILCLIKDKILDGSSLVLTCKWGFDGSANHSTYKQKFSNCNSTDEYMFLIGLVPVHLKDGETVIWKNETPSSSLYCRPIKFIFCKESPLLVKNEKKYIQEQIDELQYINFKIDTKKIDVSYNMLFTMVDGSVLNVISGTNSSQTCYICGATPKQMNLQVANPRLPKENMYAYGLSTLHLWIRCFECLLHIAYRLPLKTWQVKGDQAKQIIKGRKVNIQHQFKEQLGLNIDKPKSGFGSTNDGNTARRFFGNPEASSNITGINIQLIKNLGIILRVISSGLHININTFTSLINETKQMYLSLYAWYYMPVTLHKLLIHGPEVIKSLILPVGQLSEEALEARHKDVRYLRLHNTRKTSRCATNKDLLNMLLLTSDPQLSSIRKNKVKNKDTLDPNITKYLILDSDNALYFNLISLESDDDQ